MITKNFKDNTVYINFKYKITEQLLGYHQKITKTQIMTDALRIIKTIFLQILMILNSHQKAKKTQISTDTVEAS